MCGRQNAGDLRPCPPLRVVSCRRVSLSLPPTCPRTRPKDAKTRPRWSGRSWLSRELIPKQGCGPLSRAGRHDASSSVTSVALLGLLPLVLASHSPITPSRRNPVLERVFRRRGGIRTPGTGLLCRGRAERFGSAAADGPLHRLVRARCVVHRSALHTRRVVAALHSSQWPRP